jgi:tetratricopeptide (TPR) repeat protein
MCYARKKEWTPAVQDFQKAVELDPENRPFANTLGFALARAGQYDESLRCFARLQGEAMAHYQLARMLQHLQQTDLCRQHLELALAKDPKLDAARQMKDPLDGRAGQPVQAIQTVGYAEPQPQPAAEADARPMVVEVNPELSEGRRILPPPPVVCPSVPAAPATNETPVDGVRP